MHTLTMLWLSFMLPGAAYGFTWMTFVDRLNETEGVYTSVVYVNRTKIAEYRYNYSTAEPEPSSLYYFKDEPDVCEQHLQDSMTVNFQIMKRHAGGFRLDGVVEFLFEAGQQDNSSEVLALADVISRGKLMRYASERERKSNMRARAGCIFNATAGYKFELPHPSRNLDLTETMTWADKSTLYFCVAKHFYPATHILRILKDGQEVRPTFSWPITYDGNCTYTHTIILMTRENHSSIVCQAVWGHMLTQWVASRFTRADYIPETPAPNLPTLPSWNRSTQVWALLLTGAGIMIVFFICIVYCDHKRKSRENAEDKSLIKDCTV
ncbi:ORF38 [Ranid herpesvirus 2]|uniref:ORF38 n=1 Tax=Ranid herpesvirus 2 TaxID=389214 RepID=Q14W68_9VIRU|nr:ORF38 [Ranid herpesvirus 2]ABG25638.1 ORF38 [Ranid herpesvirus 2]